MRLSILLLALSAASVPQPASAQINTDGLIEFTLQRIAPPSSAPVQEPAVPWQYIPKAEVPYQAQPTRPAPPLSAPLIPANPSIPPVEFDGTYRGKLTISKMDDFSVIQYICKSPNAVACAVHTASNCLILLGPGTWNRADVLRHEMGHCWGWPGDHPGARYEN
jgi:hypothetical protein